MGFLNNLKYKYGLHRLDKDFRKPSKDAVVCNLKNAKSIGIVFDATEEAHFHEVKKTLNNLKNIIPEVKALGFVNKKKLENFHIQPLDFSFFCLNDLNFYFKPQEASVIDFVSQKFDILINLTLIEYLPVRFVVAQSQALFKVGLYNNMQPDYHDVLIKLPEVEEQESNPADVELNKLTNLIEQVIHYLSIIKPFDDEN